MIKKLIIITTLIYSISFQQASAISDEELAALNIFVKGQMSCKPDPKGKFYMCENVFGMCYIYDLKSFLNDESKFICLPRETILALAPVLGSSQFLK